MAVKTFVNTVTGASVNGIGTDEVTNESSVTGATASDALNNLETDIGTAQTTADNAQTTADNAQTDATSALAQDLQDIYGNGSDGIITTDDTNGALIVRGGTGTNTDNNIESKNNAGTTTFEVNGVGAVTANSYNGVELTTGGVATNYLDETGNYSTPAGGGSSPVKNVWRDSENTRNTISAPIDLMTIASVTPSNGSNSLFITCTFAIYGTDGDEMRVTLKDGLTNAYDTTVVANGTIQYVTLTVYNGASNTSARDIKLHCQSAASSIRFCPDSNDLAGAQQTRADLTCMEIDLS